MVSITIANHGTKSSLCAMLTEAVSPVRLELHAGRRDVLHATQESFDDDILHTHHQAWRCMKKVLTRQDGSSAIGARFKKQSLIEATCSPTAILPGYW